MTATSPLHEMALGLARTLPALGLIITEPLPEMLRDSRSQMILLQILSQRTAVTVSEMATAMGISVPTVSAMVRKMVDKGLLERSHDPKDWRSIRLSLSVVGAELLQEMLRRRAQAMEELLIRLSDQDLAVLQSAVPILSRLVVGPK